jgi:hypothetical protein
MSPEDEKAERVGWLFGVFRSTVDTVPHPTDGLDHWREGWARVRRLVDEIDQTAGRPAG